MAELHRSSCCHSYMCGVIHESYSDFSSFSSASHSAPVQRQEMGTECSPQLHDVQDVHDVVANGDNNKSHYAVMLATATTRNLDANGDNKSRELNSASHHRSKSHDVVAHSDSEKDATSSYSTPLELSSVAGRDENPRFSYPPMARGQIDLLDKKPPFSIPLESTSRAIVSQHSDEPQFSQELGGQHPRFHRGTPSQLIDVVDDTGGHRRYAEPHFSRARASQDVSQGSENVDDTRLQSHQLYTASNSDLDIWRGYATSEQRTGAKCVVYLQEATTVPPLTPLKPQEPKEPLPPAGMIADTSDDSEFYQDPSGEFEEVYSTALENFAAGVGRAGGGAAWGVAGRVGGNSDTVQGLSGAALLPTSHPLRCFWVNDQDNDQHKETEEDIDLQAALRRQMEVQNSKSPQGSTAALFSLPQPPVDFSGAQNDPEIDQISAVDSASAPKQPETPASSNSIEMVSTVQVLTEQEVEEQEIHAAKLVNHLWDSLTHNVAYETCTDDEDGGGGGSNMHGSIIHGSNMHAVHGTYGDRRPQSLPNPPMDAMHGVHGMQGKLGIHAMHNRREEVLEGFGWAVCSGLKRIGPPRRPHSAEEVLLNLPNTNKNYNSSRNAASQSDAIVAKDVVRRFDSLQMEPHANPIFRGGHSRSTPIGDRNQGINIGHAGNPLFREKVNSMHAAHAQSDLVDCAIREACVHGGRTRSVGKTGGSKRSLAGDTSRTLGKVFVSGGQVTTMRSTRSYDASKKLAKTAKSVELAPKSTENFSSAFSGTDETGEAASVMSGRAKTARNVRKGFRVSLSFFSCFGGGVLE